METQFKSHLEWLVAHKDYDGEGCLTWPFGCDPDGYGQVKAFDRVRKAHRVMCEIVNGPGGKLQASHTCGNGAGGCVHPKHLVWKTNGQNQLDRAKHGTKNTWSRHGKITPQQRSEIVALKGKMKQADIAKKFGISRSRVSGIIHDKPRRSPVGASIDGKKWRARIYKNGELISLGLYETKDEATRVYWEARHRILRRSY